ncbi:MAG: type II toxin-antitoxin system VapC family toxin [Microcystis sp.]|jgi:PIN domain nuclease of toxin-antitoxin system|uniref:Type II toxin-antitoxin system VapC family toxin n=1 Tax=Microcystis aeruginosa Ma_SC_T_19800800_S464 TaxID=2486257 RepID=A0A552DRK0_MICAE|nr:type II toxin-antitoxin system VapC family toxin [Microcystis sp. LE17-20D]MCZ8162257.1 type II toxin-antitoxin system VapC family toxin [Microcystis sp. LE19-196.1B]MCZ8275116.1 type II toxin-antitoxin system VapC family toxin [Microcystis sp. LE19-4.1E]TRT82539.1 MAG: type II toxin-antitoxin system VapC family toxin [Microcystis aeruginosa Ma_AC_P_19900807_S299]TRU24779.1 MAG: type II toxin-antitoxin system VapC family toxin [Microcystis aeruginosa Ma_SC_T_19800800_S464]MCZ8065258.1 type 
MIILDTHIWLWWVDSSSRLTARLEQLILEHQVSQLGVSIFSCWEVAKLVEKNRVELSYPVDEWLNYAIAYPGVQLLPLTLPIIVQSTQLAGFHNDPADQIIVATAKVHNCPLLTVDEKILAYPDLNTLK